MYERWVQWRMWGIGALLVLAMAGLAGRLCFLHLGDQEPVTRAWEMKLSARRGTIYDRNGDSNPMAVSLSYHQAFIDPLAIKPKHDPHTLAALLSLPLSLPPETILACFASTNSRHQILPTLVDDRVCREISTNRNISGVGWEDRAVRNYPQGPRMSNVIGFVNKERDAEGGSGLELHCNSYLKGISGRIEGEKDARQIEIADRRTSYITPIDGASIYLTLDNNIQYKVEKELAAVAQDFHASGAWAIVEKIDTGEILAMASVPTFDPNSYEKFNMNDWRNLPICVSYEPGSTMKSFTVAAALNERLITPGTRMDVGRGTWFFAGHVLHDHAEGVIDTATALSESSNIFVARVALLLGENRLKAYQHAFGFGGRLGIDLPGEATGLLRTGKWGELATTRIGIGQGVAVTGLQMLNGYCCLANGGRLMKPYVIARIVNSQGTELLHNRPQVLANPVRPDVAASVCKMLVGVTEKGGTAMRARVPNYEVAGKTGTAQIPENGHYSESDFWASFVGFLPADKPAIGVLVVVERPHPQHLGGFVSAPVFSKIAEAAAKYLEIPTSMAPEPLPEPTHGALRPATGKAP